jgi:hypothetical protein
MKKLRMIVTSVIVLTIVGSAFAFKVKVWSWCVLDANVSGTNCTTYLHEKRITTEVTFPLYKYYQNWDGNPTVCTAAGNGLCTNGPVRLKID